MRRRLWPAGELPQPPRFASAPFGFAASPTSVVRAIGGPGGHRYGRAVPPTLPPPPPPPPRRRSFKRPSPSSTDVDAACDGGDTVTDVAIATPSGRRPATPKRRRLARTPLGDATNASQQPQPQQQPSKKPPLLLRCTSEMSALATKALDSAKVDNAITSIDSLNLIGNSEQQHSLPTVKELSYGIRYVTGATVSRLVRGDYSDRVPRYSIIDCRFPYEFDGGHIQGAVNIYKQEDLVSRVIDAAVVRATEPGDSEGAGFRQVLIFHCEFSSERAPKLASFLRQRDRNLNCYPDLYFPEVYVLQGGYKSFFESHKEQCHPLSYTRMTDPSFKSELAAFQRDRKAWERHNSRTSQLRRQGMASSRACFH